MSKIKNIIFDLGGVFLQVNYQKTEDAFVKLGITNFAEYYKQDFVSTLFEDLEIGSISPQEFYDGLRNITQSSLTNQQIEIAWNAMLGNFWEDRLSFLEEIGKQYNVFLFSNTNQIHYECFIDIYQQTYPSKRFSNYFIKDYYSHILKMRKPYPNSYTHLLEQENLLATETLFIDDTFKNIEGANQAGLQVLHLLPSMNLQDEVNVFLEKLNN
jgi:putative hydrolase of the HAD superfamily